MDSKKRIIDLLNKDIGPKRIPLRLVSLFLKQLSLLLNSGHSFKKSLEIIRGNQLDKRISKALSIVLDQLDRGEGPYEAFLGAGAYFTPMLISFIRTGLRSGRLSYILDDLADFYIEDSKNKSTIKEALAYPILLLVVTFLVVGAILTFVMPSFIGVFRARDARLPLATRILIGLSNFMSENFLIIILLILVLILIFLLLRMNEDMSLRIDYLIYKFAPFKRLRKTQFEYQLSLTYSMLRRGGISDKDAFFTIKDAYKNTYVRQVIGHIEDDIERGLDLGQAFIRAGIFSNLFISMIRIGEETSSLDLTLEKISDYYRDEYIYRLKRLAKLSEPVLILIMSLIVAFVVFAVSIPMFDAVNFGSI